LCPDLRQFNADLFPGKWFLKRNCSGW